MNSTNRKFKYRFRVHNKEELESISKYIKRRRIGAFGKSCTWVEFDNYDSFLEWAKRNGSYDIFIRVYFSIDHKRNQFREQIQKTLPFWICGNDNCGYERCKYHIYNNSREHGIEYLWRCILADEQYSYDEEDEM